MIDFDLSDISFSIAFVFLSLFLVQLLPPKLLLVTHEESLEISWNSTCDEQQFSWGHCDVQYRIEGDQVWLQVSDLGFVFHNFPFLRSTVHTV